MIAERPTREIGSTEVGDAGVVDVDVAVVRRPVPSRAPAPPARRRLRDSLGSPQELRRAVLLREILDPPVALRSPKS